MTMLSRGSTGPAVKTLQETLQSMGWAIIPDGSFGLFTDLALRDAQCWMGLTPDGVYGPATKAWLARNAAVRVERSSPSVLEVAYRSQRDNVNSPSSTCNVTSYAMLLSSVGIKDPDGKQLEDRLFELITSPEGASELRARAPWAAGKFAPWTVHVMLVWAASKYGVTTQFTTHKKMTDISLEVRAGRPVVIAGKFTGSGHIVCVVGVSSDGQSFVVHDPWGDWNRGYRSHDGASRVYTAESLDSIVGRDGSVWMHTLGGAG